MDQTEICNWRRQFFSSEVLDETCVRFAAFGAAADDAMVARSACSMPQMNAAFVSANGPLCRVEQRGAQGTREVAKTAVALLPAG